MLAQHGKAGHAYGTPQHLIDDARYVLGHITLDPMSDAEQNSVVRADRIFTEQENGLGWLWYGNVFINPDGKLVKEAWAKAVDDFQRFRCQRVFWVGYSLEQLAYLSPSPLGFSYCVLRKRLKFTAWRWHMGSAAEAGPDGYEWRRSLDIDQHPTHSNYVALLTRGYETRERFQERFKSQGFVHLEEQRPVNNDVRSEFTESRSVGGTWVAPDAYKSWHNWQSGSWEDNDFFHGGP